MSLDDLATRAPRRRAKECGVAFALRVLPPDRATVLARALDNDAVQHVEISDALAAELPVDAPDAFAVGRHRNGRCACAGVTLTRVDTA